MPSIDTLRDFIVRELHWTGNVSDLTGDYPLIENHVIDSMGLLMLVTYLEDELGVQVSDEELVPDNFSTLSKIAAMVDRKRGAKERAGDVSVS